MGATKLLSEKIIVNAPLGLEQTQFCCVRFGNVLGSVGSVVPLFRQQIAQGGPVTVTSEAMTRYVMTIPQSVRLVLGAAARMRGHEIFILKMNRMRILDLAEVMIEALAPRCGYRASQIAIEIIGERPGEKTHELLITEEESAFAEELDDLIVVHGSPFDRKTHPPIHAQAILKAAMGKIIAKETIRRILDEDGLFDDIEETTRPPVRLVALNPPEARRAVAGGR
jgi:FlaA1/EpsC-like NDP-sugar epimerase